MFVHKFKYTLKILLKKRMLIFWTLAFPVFLGTFFTMAFSDIEKGEALDIIDIAIVDNDDYKQNEVYQTVFQKLSDKNNKDRLFHTVYVKEEKAIQLLEDKKISGYIILHDQKPTVVIQTNGINETILNQVITEIESQNDIYQTIIQEKVNEHETFDFQTLYQNIEKTLNEKVKIKNISNKNMSYTMIEFYSLIAMTCLYGGIIAKTALSYELPNMTAVGKRNSVTPIKKFILILGSLAASYLIQLVGLILLYLYTIFVLKVDYGIHFDKIILLSLAGSLAGLSLGIGVSCLSKASENAKTGITIALTMAGSFLAGMMGITMKYVIDKNIPIINKLNPVNMITDGLYSLYYYDTFDRFYFNFLSLLIFSVIVIGISIFQIRRSKYDSL
ncbi:MAG: ABC transporter permease [Faecalibacillus sp.]